MALALALPAFAQTQQPVTHITGGLGNGTVSASGVVANPNADQALLTQIVAALAGDTAIVGAQIDVQVVGGRVTLNGITRDTTQSEAAKAIAADFAQPANVVSNLTSGSSLQ